MGMKRFRWIVIIAFAASLLSVAIAKAMPVTFTGDVEADFPIEFRYPDRSGVGDVGIPGAAPPGTAVGWDLENIGIEYDETSDTLFVGFNMGNAAVSGDADGDGDPGSTAVWLSDLLGTDLPDLSGTEALDILIDVDQSCDLGSGQASDFEVIAGVPNNGDIGAFAVSPFSQSPTDFTNPGAGHTTPTSFTGSVFVSPSAAQPDFEFQIDNFCATVLPGCTPGETPVAFAFRARAGSGADDGIGEDAIACTDINVIPGPTAIALGTVQGSTGIPAAWFVVLALLALLTGSIVVMTFRRQRAT